jgi:hypothetical protein
MAVQANRNDLIIWAGSRTHGRYDYDSNDHLFAEMQNAGYFGTCYDLLKAGDYVHVVDANHEAHDIRIDEVDDEDKTVSFSLISKHHFTPVAARADDTGLAVRWKGPKHKFAVIDASGAIVSSGHAEKSDAERELIKRAA